MPLAFYKPNSRKSGCACSLKFNSKEESLFVNLIKQVDWNNETHRGTFKGGKQCAIKFGISEIGALIDTIERGRETSGFHAMPNGSQKIQYKFAPYSLGEGEARKLKGYGLSVTRSETNSEAESEKFQIPFTFGEAVALREYLRFTLGHIYTAIYSADKQAYLESQNEKGAGDEAGTKTPAKRGRKPKAVEPAAPSLNTPVVEKDPFAEDDFVPQPAAVGAKVLTDVVEKPEEKTDETPTNTDNTQDEDIF